MEKIKKLKYFLYVFLFCSVVTLTGYYIYYVRNYIPDEIYLNENDTDSIDINLAFIGTVESKDRNEDKALATSVNLMEPLSFETGKNGTYVLDVKLFGLFTIKQINVTVNESIEIIPCGIPVGIYIETDGVLIVGIGDLTDSSGVIYSPSKGVLKEGDYITAVNGNSISSKSELVDSINKNGNDYIVFTISRDGDSFDVKIKPVKDADGVYRIGAWVRDDCQGLGTLTYIAKDGTFGALGHPISDVDTGERVCIEDGELYCANIWSIIKGESGTPGEVIGSIDYSDKSYLGEIFENSSIGIYGKADKNIYNHINKDYLEVGYKQEVKEGPAFVRTFVNGEVKDYEINITGLDYANDNVNKGITFEVTDKELLDLTNGIIQGMSGSPIIQNNKIVGAVTHVFVKDSHKGYGIFIETMLSH